MTVRLNVILSDELEHRFREEVFRRYGMKKGNLAKAFEEAIKLWIEEGKKQYEKSFGNKKSDEESISLEWSEEK